MALYCQSLHKQSLILQCDSTKEAYIPNIYSMSGDWVKAKQTHTLFGQIALLASCSNHACVVHSQQLRQNSFQLHPCRWDQVEANTSDCYPCRVRAAPAGTQPHHVFSRGDLCAWHILHGFIWSTRWLWEVWLILRSFFEKMTQACIWLWWKSAGSETYPRLIFRVCLPSVSTEWSPCAVGKR